MTSDLKTLECCHLPPDGSASAAGVTMPAQYTLLGMVFKTPVAVAIETRYST